MRGGGFIGFGSGVVTFQQCLQMDSAATEGTEFFDVEIIFKQFGWQFAVGLCSCKFAKVLCYICSFRKFRVLVRCQVLELRGK